jgi:hypothetical protein
VQLHDVANERETEAETAELAGAGAIGLPESLEDVGRKSASIPRPVSATVTVVLSPSCSIATPTSPPAPVNLIAFERRFQRTC